MDGDGLMDAVILSKVNKLSNLQNSNLFDPATITTDYYVSSTTGNLVSAASFITSDYILIDPLKTVTIDRMRYFAFYTSAKVFISGGALSGCKFNVLPPTNALYIRFSYVVADGIATADRELKQDSNFNATLYAGYKFLGSKVIPAQLTINVPAIYGVVGKEIKIYYKNILPFLNTEKYIIDAYTGSVYSVSTDDYLAVTFATTGTKTIYITIYDAATGNEIAKANIRCVVKAVTVGGGSTRKLLIIGDSGIKDGTAQDYLLVTLLSGDSMGGKITLLGRETTTNGAHPSEGLGGFSASNFCTSASSGGYTNRFLNGGVFDFANYMTTYSYSMTTGDHVWICLGGNDVFSYNNDTDMLAAIPTILGYYDTMIASIRAYSANVNIGIGLPLPGSSLQSDFVTAYAASLAHPPTAGRYRRNIYLFTKALIAKYIAKETSKTYILSDHLNINAATNYASAIHLAEAGLRLRAASWYAYLKGFES